MLLWVVAPVVVIVIVVEAADPLGVTEAGEKLQVASDGRPEQAKVTAALNPLVGVTLSVTVALAPAATESVEVAAPMLKSTGNAATTEVVVSA